MSKAIQGLAMIGGAIALGAVAAVLASTGVGFAALPFLLGASATLGLGGIAMEAGALAQALTSNRGANITVRQPAAYRQVIYGTQRVGGIMVYNSTTGRKHDQVNYIIAIAGHMCDSILNAYLDGRQIHWQVGSVGNSTRNGVNFGGSADGGTYTGPGGAQYSFGGIVYMEACYGDQTNHPNTTPGGGYNTGLHANDPTWAPTAQGLPYLGGCTYVYFKYVYDATQFPQPPEVRFTVRGKNDILDPRTGLRGYTSNWALVVADVFTNTQFGLGDPSVNQAQLIVAANVCDEQVDLAGGGTENRYDCHYHFDTSTAPGAQLAAMMPAAAGRFARSGGEWYLYPAYWQGPTFSFNDDHLCGGYVWNPTRERRDLCNRMTGTYTAPNFPYNATTENGSNLYDGNGFYDGTIENNFGLAFQATSIPYYAADVLHGYPANQYLNEDGGELLQRDLSLPCVLSVAQAQRILKIELERNRQQGTGTLLMFPTAFQMMQMDVMQFSMARMGWTDKVLEVTSVALGVAPGENGVPTPQVKVGVQETAASVYEWTTAEELDVYLTEVAPSRSYQPYPPENMRLTSSIVTAIVGRDGVVQPRIEVQWDTPPDGLVTQVQMQYQIAGAAAWSDGGLVDVSLNYGYLSPVAAGLVYNVQIRSLRAGGAASAWVQINGFTAGVVLSILSQTGVGRGSLIGEAFADGTAGIVCEPFTAPYGSSAVPVLPGGAFTLTGLNPSQLYYVYYVDAACVGGAITPVATQNRADFDGKVGYFLIDSLVTPAYTTMSGGAGGPSARYVPSTYSDVGSRTTSTPTAAYDGDVTTDARVSGTYTPAIRDPDGTYTIGDCIWQGFPGVTLTVAATLHVTAAITSNGLECSILGAGATLVDATSTVAETTYTAPIAAGTNLGSITVEAIVDGSTGVGSAGRTGSIAGFEIWIDT